MNWTIPTIAVFFLLMNPILAQDVTQTVRGVVLDAETKIPLTGATVMFTAEDRSQGVTTDFDGKFKLENIQVGRIDLKVNYLGYEERFISNLAVISGKETVLTIELVEKAFETSEIVISAAAQGKGEAINEMALVSTRQFTIEESRRYAGARDDVSRMAANYAGVSGANDSRNDIVIRGNTPLGLLWRMEGIDIPNPNHFGGFGSTGGPVSILNNNVLANSDFYTGAFPAEYGNALSGVFDLRLRNGNNEQYEFMGQMGFNGFEAGIEGPINKAKGSSFLLNYRYSTLGLFDLVGINFGYVGIPQYQDVAFKINLPNKTLGNISIFGVGGISSIEMLDSERDEDELNLNGNNRDLRNRTKMGVVGVSHRYLINDHAYTNFTIAATGQQEVTEIDTLNELGINPGLRYLSDFNQQKITGRFVYNNKISTRHTLRLGATGTVFFNDFIDSARVDEVDYTFLTLRDFDQTTELFQLFAQSKYRLSEKVTVVGGLYSQYLTFNDTWSVEPRLSVQYQVNRQQALTLAAGRHGQIQPFGIYFDQTRLNDGQRVMTNENLEFTYSNHFIAAYDYRLSNNLRLKTEAYYQAIENVPVLEDRPNFSLLNYGADFGNLSVDSLVNQGRGRNYGIELTLEKFFSNHYYFLLTTSLFQSEYEGVDGVWRNSIFNTNYVVNGLFGMEFNIGKKDKLAIDFKATIAGGRRYTPIDLAASLEAGETVFVGNTPFEAQFIPYIKPDFKISYRQNSKNFSQIWMVSIENFINRKNIFRQYFDGSAIRTEYQLGLFPVFQYRIEF